MKIGSRVFEKPNEHIVVIPRQDGNVAFSCRAVLDFSEFDDLVPTPEPPFITKAGEEPRKDFTDEKFLDRTKKHSEKRFAWMFLKSVESTEDLQWDTVDMADSDTWVNYEAELRMCYFTEVEINLITRGVLIANSLDEAMLEEARSSFLASREVV